MAAGLQHISVSKVPLIADVGVDVEVDVEVVLLDELDKAKRPYQSAKLYSPSMNHRYFKMGAVPVSDTRIEKYRKIMI